jgi:hypothetical protein
MKADKNIEINKIFNVIISIHNNSNLDIDLNIESKVSDSIPLISHDSSLYIGKIEKSKMKFFTLRYTGIRKGLILIPSLILFDKLTSKYLITNCECKIFVN